MDKIITILLLVLIFFIIYKNYKSEFGVTQTKPVTAPKLTSDQINKEEIIKRRMGVIASNLQVNKNITNSIKKSNDLYNSKQIQDTSNNALLIQYNAAVKIIQDRLKLTVGKTLTDPDKITKAALEKNLVDISRNIVVIEAIKKNKFADTVKANIPTHQQEILTNNKNIITNSKTLFDNIIEYKYIDKYNYSIQSLDNGYYVKNDRTLLNNGNTISNGNVVATDSTVLFKITPRNPLYTINNLNLDSSLNLVSTGTTQWSISTSDALGFLIYYTKLDKPTNYLSISPTGKLGIAVRPYYWIINTTNK
jgi:hypothetical protein